eukprot:4628692-Lingulodinium_polyedra.AAC.1
MYSLPGTPHWLTRDGCDGCHQQMVAAGNQSNAPSLRVPARRQTVMQFVIRKPHATVCKAAMKICQRCK